MVHEYIEDDDILLGSLQKAHLGLDFLREMMSNILEDCNKRGYL